MVAHPHRGYIGQAFVQKTSPWSRSQPLGGGALLLEDEGWLERNPTDNPTSRPEGAPQVLFSRRTSTTRQIRRAMLVESALVAAVMWNNSVVLPYGFTSGLLGIYWD